MCIYLWQWKQAKYNSMIRKHSLELMQITVQDLISMLKFNFKYILPKLDYKFNNASLNLKRV